MPIKSTDDFDGFINLHDEKVHVSDAERISNYILKRLPPGKDQRGLLRHLAVYCFEEGFYDASSVYLRQILTIANDPAVRADCHLSLGQVREANKDYVGALKCYEEAFMLDAGCDDTWYFLHNNRAFCLNQLGRHDEANRYSRRAIEINPKRYNAYKNLGVALEGRCAYAEAAACFIQAATLFPPDYRSIEHLETLLATHRVEIESEIPDIDKRLSTLIELYRGLIQ